MEFFVVHGPGDVEGEPVRHGDEYTGFVVDCYAVGDDLRNTHRLYDSAFLSRPKGCDKSGFGARFGLFEALGPSRFAGWARGGEVYEDPWGLGFHYVYESGEPMGRPVQTPYIRIMATEEGQTGNVYDTIYYNLTEGPLAQAPGVDAGLSRVNLPGNGEITPSTASSASKDGGKETFVVFDESHLYNQPELRQMYTTVTRNLRKRKRIAGTWYLETTTMFAPGENSIAESTYQEADAIKAGRKRSAGRLLYDHRWGECEDLSNEEALRAAITEAFGEAIGWQDLDSLVDEFYDTRNSVSDSRRYFLNAETNAADAWLARHEWVARSDASVVVADREMITLGFDGSRKRQRTSTDATALVACRVSDGHVWPLGIWEEPEGAAAEDWRVPVDQVRNAVAMAFDKYQVVGFYADPAKWEGVVTDWEATYGARLKVKASRSNAIEWWMTGGRAIQIVRALERFANAVTDGEMTHDGDAVLTRHALNARRRPSRSGLQIAKEHPSSDRKIDAVVAAVLAFEARADAIAKGVLEQAEEMQGYTF
jgi:phage terminase large subunit-like protein